MIDGFINLNKPISWTSHDCVARLRGLLKTKKIGHGGTLDPLATGVLPIAVGRATRLIQYLPERKAYRAVVRFGLTTTTDDLEGEILTEQSALHLQQSDIEAHLPNFLGTLSQVPPMYSAIQVNGKRLYDLARQGKTLEVPTRSVSVNQIVVRGWQAGLQPAVTLDIDCGPGTYIRSLARDLGVAVGTGATLIQLTRSHSSGFDLSESITLETIEQVMSAKAISEVISEATSKAKTIEALQAALSATSAGAAVQHLPDLALPPALALRWQMGQKLATADMDSSVISSAILSAIALDSPLRVMDAATGNFLGIGEIRAVPPVGAIPGEKVDLHNILVAKRVFLQPSP